MQLRKIAGFAFGPMAAALFSLLAVPLTAWVFTPADVGRLNVLQIALSFALLLFVLGLDQAYVREFHEAKDRAQLLRACFAPGFICLLVLGGISAFFAAPLAQWLYAEPNPWWYWATLAAFFISYASRFLSLILRMQERGWAYSASQVLPKALQLALVLGVAWAAFQKTFTHLLLITLASLALVLGVYAWNTRQDWGAALSAKVDRRQLHGLLGFGTPLIFTGLAFWGLSATSTIALRTWSTLDELAVYSVASSFAGAALVFQAIFSVVWAPTVYKWSAQGADMQVVDKIAKQVLGVVCAIVLLCAAFAWVLDYVLPAHYASVKSILLCMLMQPLLYTLSEVTGVGIGIERRTILSVWVTLAALATNAMLSYCLVPTLGATGAAISNATAFTVFFIARTETSARVWRNFRRGYLYVTTLALLGLAIFVANPSTVNFLHLFS